MILHLIHCFCIIILQALFLLFHAYRVHQLDALPRLVRSGLLLGVPFGVTFDLIIGDTLGVFSYELGFPLWFLLINGALSYGLMIANVGLLYRHSFAHVYGWFCSARLHVRGGELASAGVGMAIRNTTPRVPSSYFWRVFCINSAHGGLPMSAVPMAL